jgi:hypothetical protein
VPFITPGLPEFAAIAALAATLAKAPRSLGASAALQARVARLYELSAEEFGHVLGTFPLVPVEEREAAMAAFCGPTR